MIKFFRKIRQNLLLDNKTGTYLKYALGEIVLVVIGILIALSINNWNQQRVLKKQSDLVLYNLQQDIKKSKNELQKATEFLKSRIDKRLNYLNTNKQDQSDSLKIQEISNMAFFYTESVKLPIVESELGTNKTIFQWPELTEGMQNVYESIAYYNKGIEYIENDMHSNMLPYLVKKGVIIDIMIRDGILNRANYLNADVYNSEEFRNVIASSTLMTSSLLKAAQNILDDYEELLIIIRKERE